MKVFWDDAGSLLLLLLLLLLTLMLPARLGGAPAPAAKEGGSQSPLACDLGDAHSWWLVRWASSSYWMLFHPDGSYTCKGAGRVWVGTWRVDRGGVLVVREAEFWGPYESVGSCPPPCPSKDPLSGRPCYSWMARLSRVPLSRTPSGSTSKDVLEGERGPGSQIEVFLRRVRDKESHKGDVPWR